MPTTVNLTGGGAQLGTYFVRSVTFWSYASADDQTVEVPPASARDFIAEFFSGVNGNGTDFGRASIATSDLTFQHYGRANIQDLLVGVFPPPGPDA